MPDELSERHILRRLVGLVVFIAAIALAITALPGLGTLRHRFLQVDPLLLVAIALLKLGSSLSNVVAFRDVFCRRMGWRSSYQLAMAEQATNVLVPTGGAGGLALGAWALRQGGMSTQHIARRSVAFFVLTSIPNFLCAAVLGPLLLAGVLSGKAPVVPTAVFTARAFGVSALAAALPRLLPDTPLEESTHTVAATLRSGAFALSDGIRDTGTILRSRRWRAILGAIGYLVFDIAALVVGFAAFGPVGALGPIVFGYVIGQLGGLLPLPAGVGGTDGGLIGALVLYGSPLSQAAAAVLTYRAFQVGVPALLGAIAFLRLRRTLNRSSAPASECAPLADPLSESERDAGGLPAAVGPASWKGSRRPSAVARRRPWPRRSGR